jgi:hypothetical protein
MPEIMAKPEPQSSLGEWQLLNASRSKLPGIEYSDAMLKLQQGQVWKVADNYVRIVDLQRLEVKYKSMKDIATGEGTHHHVSKKEFCRLIKGATLVTS